jgi:ferric-dicitrate binding protein FerR (iron transport regulator)
MDTEMNNPSHQHIEPELLVRFLSGEASMQEQREVTRWVEADEKNQKYFEEFSTIWNASQAAGGFDDAYLKEDWSKIQVRIKAAHVNRTSKTGTQRSLVFWLARVAAVFLFAIGLYFVTQGIYRHQPMKEMTMASGVEKVTLTLPDGSTVYLNSNSKLTYPEIFDDNAREVTLEGEAFFEVTPNSQRPFLIKTDPVTTEVVGTSFNINSKKNNVAVTVFTGKVLLYKEKADAIGMTVGEQGIYSDKGLTKKVNRDPNLLSWKTNVLIFQNTPLTKVVSDLTEHFGQRIEIAPKMLEWCTLTSRFQDQTLEEVLQELTVVFSIRVEKRGDIITLTGKGC